MLTIYNFKILYIKELENSKINTFNKKQNTKITLNYFYI